MDVIYHSMPNMWKNKIIEQGSKDADSTIKEMTDFFETRLENLEPKKDEKNLQQLQRNQRIKCLLRIGNGKTSTLVL